MSKESADWYWDAEKKRRSMVRANYQHVHSEDGSGYYYKQTFIYFYITENSSNDRWPYKMTRDGNAWGIDENKETVTNGHLFSLMDFANKYYYFSFEDVNAADMKHYGRIRPIEEMREYVQ